MTGEQTDWMKGENGEIEESETKAEEEEREIWLSTPSL